MEVTYQKLMAAWRSLAEQLQREEALVVRSWFGAPATSEDLTRTEQALGRALPESYKSFLGVVDGFHLSVDVPEGPSYAAIHAAASEDFDLVLQPWEVAFSSTEELCKAGGNYEGVCWFASELDAPSSDMAEALDLEDRQNLVLIESHEAWYVGYVLPPDEAPGRNPLLRFNDAYSNSGDCTVLEYASFDLLGYLAQSLFSIRRYADLLIGVSHKIS